MGDIDFVLPWVNGDDPAWLARKSKYELSGTCIASSDADANADCRYRDCGLLRYWFRAVERFAPWVHKVFFVTCGQKPEWLDESCPKLRLVNHAEYIPAEHLPTFHSNTIELNLHRIPDLSEKFVLFNDDILLLQPVTEEFFFKGDLPVIACDLGIPRWLGCSNTSRIALNNSGILKWNLDVEKLIWTNIWKFTDVRALGFVRAAKNIISFAVNRTLIQGTFGHLAHSHLKSTFDEIWCKVPHVLERTSRNRFRTDDCVNQWLCSAWNMVSGRFYPTNEKFRGTFFTLGKDELSEICDDIRLQKSPQVCLNDKGCNKNHVDCFAKLAEAFEDILPTRSSFEK